MSECLVQGIQTVMISTKNYHMTNNTRRKNDLAQVSNHEFQQHVEQISMRRDGEYALVYMYVSGLDTVGESRHHAIGERLLQQVANLLLANVPEPGSLTIIGGQELALLLQDCRENDALRCARLVRSKIQTSEFRENGGSFRFGISTGIVLVTVQPRDPRELLIQVQRCCRIAKSKGHNRIEFCSGV
jgi:diguanylate cyclase (GGDEF)-like protein